MHFGSHHDHLGYLRVNTSVPKWSTTEKKDSSVTYSRPFFPWRRGNRLNVIGDSLTIKIGGDPHNKKALKGKQNLIKSTKYTLITFLPQNLLEQFRRIANFYFLIMGVLSLLIDSPVSPVTSLVPLVFVISVTAAKQGYEDYLRHKADNMVNYSLVTVIRNGVECNIKCQDVMQGDIVKVCRDCDVPCDIVLLKSSDIHGKCHITTANLDGETNLKTLQIPRGIPKVGMDKLHTLGTIEFEPPRTDLYTFNGKMELSNIHRIIPSEYTDTDSIAGMGNVLPLTAENLLLRGSRIKNTNWVAGCAVYTGQTTKLALNSRLTRNKMPSSETYINRFLVFILILLIMTVSFCYFMKRYYDMFVLEHHRYIVQPDDSQPVTRFLQDYLSFLILFNYMIPISLYVSIEMHKFLGSFFMEWDKALYDEETDQPCIVNTSDLNEELGQINILFSDKTGTLTKNEMIFKECSIMGRKYHYNVTSIKEDGHPIPLKLNSFNDDQFAFFQALSICHTVQVAGESTDEESVEVAESANETVQNVFNFNENRQESADEADFIRVAASKMSNSIDNNPLLTKKTDLNVTQLELNSTGKATNDLKFNSPEWKQIQRQQNETSANKLFNDNRVHPVEMTPSNLSGRGNSTASTPEHEMAETFKARIEEYSRLQNLNRSVSHIEKIGTTTNRPEYQKHKRAHSYGAPSQYGRYSVNSSLKRSQLSRNPSSLSIRESYAAPSFTRDSLRSSIVRRNEIQCIVEKLDYQASSPDEKALVEACASLGFMYMGDDNDDLEIRIEPPTRGPIIFQKLQNASQLTFKRLHILEFTSDRKRMSVIVRDMQGDIWVYTKGAESYVFPLCTSANRELIRKTNVHINDFAEEGLRTLAVARRKLSKVEYMELSEEITRATSSLFDRERLTEDCYTKIERDLELLGATAVEDALQDNVRDTLESLEAAGIKIWVLTGDKIETALNIAISCGHIPANASKYSITDCRSVTDLSEHLAILEKEITDDPHASYALLIDGNSLQVALKNDIATKFRDVTIKMKAVLCCRLSPLQKCEIVHLIKSAPEKYITAAIGDGANDVSMIQEAHVGLGIVGKEGRQAARCADYAFANFHMMKKVLLVHGHYYSNRLSLLVLYFFYKNILFMAVQFFFQLSNMMSAQSIYDSLFLTLYNVVYTTLPILLLSLTEKPFLEDTLMSKPELYTKNTNNRRLHWKYFVGWIILALYHSVIIYFFAYAVWTVNNTILSTPYTVNLPSFGTFLIHNVVVVVNVKLWLEAVYQTYWFIVTILGSIAAFVATTVIYNMLEVPIQILNRKLADSYMYWVYNMLLSSLSFWLLSTLILIACLLPDYTIKVGQKAFGVHFKLLVGNKSKDKFKRQSSNIEESSYL